MKFEQGRIGELIYLDQRSELHERRSILFLYSLTGNTQVKTEKQYFGLKENEMLVVQNAHRLSIAPQHGICAVLKISSEFAKLFDFNNYILNCGPQNIHEIPYQKLVAALTELISMSADTNSADSDYLGKISEIMLLLKDNFGHQLFSSQTLKIEDVKNYLLLNYQQSCSLEDVAQHFTVSPQYLSSQFKKESGQTFTKFLNSVRLDQSAQDLIQSDDLILDIALNNGFGSLSTFNRLFKSKYGLAPDAYRHQHAVEAKLNDIRIDESRLEESVIKARQKNLAQQTIAVRADEPATAKPLLAEIINLSMPVSEQTADYLRQLRIHKVILKFNFPVKVDNLYLLELSRNIEHLLRAGTIIIWDITNRSRLVSQVDLQKLEQIFAYYANIISIKNVQKWEIQTDSHDAQLVASLLSELFDPLEFCPRLIVSGTYPQLQQLTQLTSVNLLADDNNLDSLIYEASELKKRHPQIDLSVTYPGIQVPNLSVLNDVNYGAARFLNFAFNLLGTADHLVIDQLRDEEHEQLLDGQKALVNYSDLPKPVFYAVNFLNRQGHQVLRVEDRYVVCFNGGRDYSLIVTNPSRVRTLYSKLDYSNYETVLEQHDSKKTISVRGLKNGRYLIKSRVVNRYVSLAKLWLDLDATASVNLEQHDYLSRKTEPDQVSHHLEVNNHRLQFDVDMSPDEILYMHLIYLY